MKRLFPLAVTLAILALCPPARGQNGMIQLPPMLENSFGTPLAGVNVSVCDQLNTSAASVTNNIASYTVSATTGFAAGQTLFVSGFTGADAYFNVSGTIVSLTSNTLSIALSHGNASASSNGSLYAEGNSTVPCAPLSTLFTDNTGAATTSNPTTSTPVGAVIGWVAPGLHELQTYGSTIPTSIQIFSVGCVPSATTATCGVYLNGNNVFTGTDTFNGAIVINVNPTGTATTGSGPVVLQTSPAITNPSTTGTDTGTETLQNKTLTGASSGNSATLLNHQGTTSTTAGTGSAQTVWTYSLPANTMQAGKGIRVRADMNHVAGSNALNLTFNFGSLQLVASSVGTANNHTNMTFDVFNNNGVTNGQVGSGLWANSTTTVATASAGAVDTTLAVTISIQTTVSSPDTWAGGLFTVELIQ